MDQDTAFRAIAQRKLTDAEKTYIQLKIEKTKLDRERSMIILDKGLLLFFAFLILAIVGFLNKLIGQMTLNILVVAGLCVLMLSILHYTMIARKSEKDIDNILKSLTGEK